MITPDSLHKIAEPLLLATAISLAVFALAAFFLWRHGLRMKQLEPEEE